jgi:hypothetical protein
MDVIRFYFKGLEWDAFKGGVLQKKGIKHPFPSSGMHGRGIGDHHVKIKDNRLKRVRRYYASRPSLIHFQPPSNEVTRSGVFFCPFSGLHGP